MSKSARGTTIAVFEDIESWGRGDAALTWGDLLRRLGERGHVFVAIVLAVPFLQPFPVFGLSTVLGTVLMAIGLAMFLERRPWIPRRLAERSVSATTLTAIGKGGRKLFGFIESFIHPRGQWVLRRRSFQRSVGLLIFVSAFLLALPLPIPGTNSPPAYSIFLLSLGLLERDGILVTLGYAFFAFTIGYFAFLAWASKAGAQALLAL